MLWSLIDCFRRADGRVAWAVVAAFALLNGVVVANAWRHDPRVGYDGNGHRAYTKVLASGRLPTPQDTHEFFSPPLPYVPTAIARRYVEADTQPGRWRVDVALKVGQLAQAAMSPVLALAVLASVRMIRPRRDAFAAFCALLCLGMMPVYYRSFAMVRGEPFMATFAAVGVALTIRTYVTRRPTIGGGAMAGLAIGAACLSRQWAFFLLPGLALLGLWRLIVDASHRTRTMKAGLATMLVAAFVAAPFYLHLQYRYGSIKAFNRVETADGGDRLIRADTTDEDEPAAATAPEPVESTSLATALGRVVTAPIRDRLADHRVLLAYADAWGDYWQYFLIFAKDKKGSHFDSAKIDGANKLGFKSNYATMPAYLGRVSAAAVVPTAVLIAGLAAALASARHVRRGGRAIALPVVGLLVVSSLAGYAWFVLSYPGDRADTVKATYLLQIFPLLAITAAVWLAELYVRRPRVAAAIVVAMLIVLAHNAPACMTHTVRLLPLK